MACFSAHEATYYYHNGETWKFGKVEELKVEKHENLLYCTTCGQHYYYTGAHVRITAVIRAGWLCQKCKWCLNCRKSSQDDRYLLCDVCDGAFHAHCLRPPIVTIPKNGWKCKRCRKCTDCGARVPGLGSSSRWHSNYSVCDSCYQQRNKGIACPICGRAYRHSAQKDMLQVTQISQSAPNISILWRYGHICACLCSEEEISKGLIEKLLGNRIYYRFLI